MHSHGFVVGDVYPRTVLSVCAAGARRGGRTESKEVEETASLRRLLKLAPLRPEGSGILQQICINKSFGNEVERKVHTLFVPCQPTNSALSRLKSSSYSANMSRFPLNLFGTHLLAGAFGGAFAGGAGALAGALAGTTGALAGATGAAFAGALAGALAQAFVIALLSRSTS